MDSIRVVLETIAEELAAKAKASMPPIREDEKIMRECLENGIYRRITTLGESTYDFKIGR